MSGDNARGESGVLRLSARQTCVRNQRDGNGGESVPRRGGKTAPRSVCVASPPLSRKDRRGGDGGLCHHLRRGRFFFPGGQDRAGRRRTRGVRSLRGTSGALCRPNKERRERPCVRKDGARGNRKDTRDCDGFLGDGRDCRTREAYDFRGMRRHLR